MSNTKKTENATATKKTATKKTENTKIEKLLTIDEIVDMYHANGIGTLSTKCSSSKYRIMRGGSSLNIKRNGYTIYTTDIDYENLKKVKFSNDVEMVENGNSSDKIRKNIVTCKCKKSLEQLLKVYALNIDNLMQ